MTLRLRLTALYTLLFGACGAVLLWLSSWIVHRQVNRTLPEGFADRALAQLDALDQRETLRALECPLLAIVGGKDAFVAPDIGRHAAKLARRGQLAEFPECGHAPFIEDGPRYRQVVVDFLQSLS